MIPTCSVHLCPLHHRIEPFRSGNAVLRDRDSFSTRPRLTLTVLWTLSRGGAGPPRCTAGWSVRRPSSATTAASMACPVPPAACRGVPLGRRWRKTDTAAAQSPFPPRSPKCTLDTEPRWMTPRRCVAWWREAWRSDSSTFLRGEGPGGGVLAERKACNLGLTRFAKGSGGISSRPRTSKEAQRLAAAAVGERRGRFGTGWSGYWRYRFKSLSESSHTTMASCQHFSSCGVCFARHMAPSQGYRMRF